METNLDPLTLNKKVESLTFGSCISLSLENYDNCYLSSEGFINTKLQIKKLDSTNPNNDFNFSVFRILPFSNYGNFKHQNALYHLLQNFAEEAKILSEKGHLLSSSFFVYLSLEQNNVFIKPISVLNGNVFFIFALTSIFCSVLN